MPAARAIASMIDFDGETDAGARDAAIGQDRALVGRHRRGTAPVHIEIVRSRQQARHLRRLERRRGRVDRIGPGIDVGDAVQGQQPSVAVRIAGDAIVMLAAIGVRAQVLAAILQPAHRRAAPLRQPCQRHLFAAEQALVAEPAAHVGRDHADRAVVEIEALGDAALDQMRHLGRADDVRKPNRASQ